MNSFEESGLWWLPESPDNRVVGIAKFTDDDGFRLTIPFGLLKDLPAAFNGEIDQVPLLYGILRNGKHVSLEGCYQESMSFAMPGAPTEVRRAVRGFVGTEFISPDPLIKRATVTYSHLRDWVCSVPATLTLPSPLDGRNAEFHYSAPDDAVLASGDDWKLSLSHVAALHPPSVTGFAVDHDCQLLIECNDPIRFENFSERLLQPLSSFLSFCLNGEMRLKSLILEMPDSKTTEVGQALGQARRARMDTIIDVYMLLSMPALAKGRMADAIKTWMSFEGDERRAVSLLVALIDDRGLPVELRFLAAVQALEALSRVGAKEYELAEDEFCRRMKFLIGSIDDKTVRKWAARKLEHANQRSFIELLRDLTVSVGAYVEVLAPDHGRFLSDIRENRNFYTHRDDRRATNLLELDDLHTLTEGVLCLLRAAVLRKLGYSEDEASTIMRSSQDVSHWQREIAQMYSIPGKA